MPTDYTALDAAILDAIRAGKGEFVLINSRVEHIAETIDKRNAWRVTDRRLQALRRAGQIKYEGKQWRVA